MTNSRTVVLAMLLTCSACASTPGRSDESQVPVFTRESMPRCEYERAGEVRATATVRGSDRTVAEREVRRELVRAAAQRGMHGIYDVVVRVAEGERVPFSVVREGDAPRQTPEPPAVQWSGTAQGLRFTNPECRQ